MSAEPYVRVETVDESLFVGMRLLLPDCAKAESLACVVRTSAMARSAAPVTPKRAMSARALALPATGAATGAVGLAVDAGALVAAFDAGGDAPNFSMPLPNCRRVIPSDFARVFISFVTPSAPTTCISRNSDLR
jgi:heme A synthase